MRRATRRRSSRRCSRTRSTWRCRELLGDRVVTAPGQGTLVTARVDGDPAEVNASLYAAGVVVRSVPGEPWIRVSCGWWTSDDDLRRLVGALTQA